MKKADLLYREKRTHAEASLKWLSGGVPDPVPPSEHPFKYRLVFVRDGKRVVGYDNARGKGEAITGMQAKPRSHTHS